MCPLTMVRVAAPIFINYVQSARSPQLHIYSLCSHTLRAGRRVAAGKLIYSLASATEIWREIYGQILCAGVGQTLIFME